MENKEHILSEFELSKLLNHKRIGRIRLESSNSVNLNIGEYQLQIKAINDKLLFNLSDPYFSNVSPIEFSDKVNHIHDYIYFIKGEPVEYKSQTYFIENVKKDNVYCSLYPGNEIAISFDKNTISPIKRSNTYVGQNRACLNAFYIIAPLLKKVDELLTVREQAEYYELHKKSVERYIYKYRASFDIHKLTKLKKTHDLFQRYKQKPFFIHPKIKNVIIQKVIEIYNSSERYPLKQSLLVSNDYLRSQKHRQLSKSTLYRIVHELHSKKQLFTP